MQGECSAPSDLFTIFFLEAWNGRMWYEQLRGFKEAQCYGRGTILCIFTVSPVPLQQGNKTISESCSS